MLCAPFLQIRLNHFDLRAVFLQRLCEINADTAGTDDNDEGKVLSPFERLG